MSDVRQPLLVSLVTAPSEYPVSRTEAKLWAKIDTSDDDSVVDNLIAAMTSELQATLNRQVVTATYDLTLPTFPTNGDRYVELPFAPLQSVTYVKYYDGSNTLTTWDSANYQVSTQHEPGRVVLGFNKTWPSVYSRYDAVSIRFVCGYGAASACPAELKDALLSMIEWRYRDRGGEDSEARDKALRFVRAKYGVQLFL